MTIEMVRSTCQVPKRLSARAITWAYSLGYSDANSGPRFAGQTVDCTIILTELQSLSVFAMSPLSFQTPDLSLSCSVRARVRVCQLFNG